MRSIIAFPAEVIDLIIGSLGCDKATSSACGRVCRAWMRPARRHLFGRIKLRMSGQECKSFLALVKSSPEAASCIQEISWDIRWNHMSANVSSGGTHARQVIQRLTSLSKAQGTTHSIAIKLGSKAVDYMTELLDHAPELASHVDRVEWTWEGAEDWNEGAYALVRRLDRIRVLIIRQHGTGALSKAMHPHFPAYMFATLVPTTRITELKLFGTSFGSHIHLMQFVQAFSSLTDLTCTGPTRADSGDDERCLVTAPPLRMITFGGRMETNDALARWILSNDSLCCLESITILDSFGGPVMGSLDDLFSRHSQTLHSLYLKGALEILPDIGQCTALRTLHISYKSLEQIIPVLYTVENPSLRYLFLSIKSGSADDWRRLRVMLEKPCFQRLDTLSIFLDDADSNTRRSADAALEPLQSRPAYRRVKNPGWGVSAENDWV